MLAPDIVRVPQTQGPADAKSRTFVDTRVPPSEVTRVPPSEVTRVSPSEVQNPFEWTGP